MKSRPTKAWFCSDLYDDNSGTHAIGKKWKGWFVIAAIWSCAYQQAWSAPAFTNINVGLPGLMNGSSTVPVPSFSQVDVAPMLPGVQFGMIAWADYDLDGRLDIVLAGEAAAGFGRSGIFRNTQNGFTYLTDFPVGFSVGYLDVNPQASFGDFDSDGRWDILYGDVKRNTGTGFYSPNNGSWQRGAWDWGDYDNDGRLDYLATWFIPFIEPFSYRATEIHRNTGSNFVSSGVVLPGVDRSAVAWGDYDNDGYVDFALAGITGTGQAGSDVIAQIWRNTGTGFANLGVGLPAITDGLVAWFDFDNDGRLDLLLSGNSANPLIQIWRNTGGSFVNTQAGLPGTT